MFSAIEENYLKALYHLSVKSGTVSILELSNFLKIKMPTANSMMKKMAEKGLVKHENYKPLILTEEGKKEAIKILRKHRLIEVYLAEKMGFQWHEVHEIAEQMEHIKSEKFFTKIDELLNYPEFDPHGSPIPDANGNIKWVDLKKLSDCNIGEKVVLSAVINSSTEFLEYLNSKNFSLGLVFSIVGIEDFDKNITICIENSEKKCEVLSSLVTEKLLVQTLEI